MPPTAHRKVAKNAIKKMYLELRGCGPKTLKFMFSIAIPGYMNEEDNPNLSLGIVLLHAVISMMLLAAGAYGMYTSTSSEPVCGQRITTLFAGGMLGFICSAIMTFRHLCKNKCDLCACKRGGYRPGIDVTFLNMSSAVFGMVLFVMMINAAQNNWELINVCDYNWTRGYFAVSSLYVTWAMFIFFMLLLGMIGLCCCSTFQICVQQPHQRQNYARTRNDAHSDIDDEDNEVFDVENQI